MSQLYEIQPAPITSPAVLDSARISHLPILLLNVHTQCNCRCVMCDIWQRKDSRTMTAAEVTRHLDSFHALGVRQVVLTGGEPLLNPALAAICDLLHTLDIRITLLTTGLLLRNKAALIAAGIDDVILSIDGPPEIHNHIRRVPRAFEVIAQGVEAVRLLRPSIPITCRTTVQKQNHMHLRAAVQAAHSLALDSISFLPADVQSTAFNREQPWEAERKDEIGLNHAEVLSLEQEIEALIHEHQADIQARFIVESEAKLRRLATRFRERLEATPPRAPICNAPWVSAVMEVDGRIRPCFFHAPIGSASSGALEDALNSPAALAFRSQLDVAANPICQRCVCSLNYRAPQGAATP
ncbi:radical SAM protein [Granulicella tundricola]|uniref:Radical SAM domain protein n=1 Tax=Granulicella tundricola (strain ATCC BAA-1859 / DSM 23138 / MP5ACTX9) TaxID=1198114 RepID=E8WYP3_GRATM|nr:radical SAM protein [Granulicella tundricola]ADW67641.1 Radical SAM domain protein [Granulicella tundricola MP5ACTX9]